jgi:hypothetical protein
MTYNIDFWGDPSTLHIEYNMNKVIKDVIICTTKSTFIFQQNLVSKTLSDSYNIMYSLLFCAKIKILLSRLCSCCAY